MVYERGYLSWEWQPENALRSTLHPYLYALPFHLLKFLRLDYNCVIIWTPHFIQSIVFAIADVNYLRFVRQLLNFNINGEHFFFRTYLTLIFRFRCQNHHAPLSHQLVHSILCDENSSQYIGDSLNDY